jgi:endonuclease-3 related protein
VRRHSLLSIYKHLHRAHGHRRWWPGDSPFEIAIGAVLTQNTSWTNVEKALAVLRSRGLLSFAALRRMSPAQLAPLIRSSGYYNLKARRVLALVAFLDREYGGRIEKMAGESPHVLREKLLTVSGIGPETADSIVLYAAGLPIFVVDAYTRRVFSRLGLIGGREDYDAIRATFERALPRDAALYNDYHAQIVHLGKDYCRTKPRCAGCALERLCPTAAAAV